MEVTKVLLEHGSQVDPVDSDGQTPLHKAAERGDAETCELLVSNVFYTLHGQLVLYLSSCL